MLRAHTTANLSCPAAAAAAAAAAVAGAGARGPRRRDRLKARHEHLHGLGALPKEQLRRLLQERRIGRQVATQRCNWVALARGRAALRHPRAAQGLLLLLRSWVRCRLARGTHCLCVWHGVACLPLLLLPLLLLLLLPLLLLLAVCCIVNAARRLWHVAAAHGL
jgi:hypothetical protein